MTNNHSVRSMASDLKWNCINVPGWRTDRKIVVIESDDWGSIRMPSQQVYKDLLQCKDKVDSDPFCKYDSLASSGDLTALFDTLSDFRDSNGNAPVITANCIMTNPDFDKIRDSGYQHYHYEVFTETLKRYPDHNDSFNLWQQGIAENLLYPQLHGREHLNVVRWMNDLRAGKPDVLRAFERRMISTGDAFTKDNKYAYMDAFNCDSLAEQEKHMLLIDESATIFKRLFGFKSNSFIAPCNVWSRSLEKALLKNDIRYIQGAYVQLVPRLDDAANCFHRIYHHTGQVNQDGQIYLVRNCSFEPSINRTVDWVDECLHRINVAFRWKKPAIICSHRLNYIGSIDSSNRDRNLNLLRSLLGAIRQYWPDIEYMNTCQLGDLISGKR